MELEPMVSWMIIPVSLLSMPGSILMKSSWNKVLRSLSGLSKPLKSCKVDFIHTWKNYIKTIFPQAHMISWENLRPFKVFYNRDMLSKEIQSRMKKRQLLRIKSANFPDNFRTLALGQGTIQIGRSLWIMIRGCTITPRVKVRLPYRSQYVRIKNSLHR